MTYSISQIRERYGVSKPTVLGWIKSGELRAVNVGMKPGKKLPRWRITEEALAEFELIRSSSPPPPRVRRRRRQPDDVIQFYK